MKIVNRTFDTTAVLAFALIALVGCKKEEPVSFSQDVQPIIDTYCIECHQPGGKVTEASGFRMDSYQGLMKGTRNGPMIIAGDAEGSNMVVLMEGRADPSISMPHGKMEGATQKDIDAIRRWINQGAQNN